MAKEGRVVNGRGGRGLSSQERVSGTRGRGYSPAGGTVSAAAAAAGGARDREGTRDGGQGPTEVRIQLATEEGAETRRAGGAALLLLSWSGDSEDVGG